MSQPNVFLWRGKPSIFAKDKRFTWNAPKRKPPVDAVTNHQSINTEALDREIRRMAVASR